MSRYHIGNGIFQCNGETWINGQRFSANTLQPGASKDFTAANGMSVRISKNADGTTNSIVCSGGGAANVMSFGASGGLTEPTSGKSFGQSGAGEVFSGNHQTIATPACTVVGNHNTVSGAYCKVTGNHNNVSGAYCEVTGNYNSVTGAHSTAHGYANSVSGNCSQQASYATHAAPPSVQDTPRRGALDDLQLSSLSEGGTRAEEPVPKLLASEFLDDEASKRFIDEPAESEAAACIVCLENKRQLGLNCGHVPLCFSCIRKLFNEKNLAFACPHCRQPITKIKRMFI